MNRILDWLAAAILLAAMACAGASPEHIGRYGTLDNCSSYDCGE